MPESQPRTLSFKLDGVDYAMDWNKSTDPTPDDFSALAKSLRSQPSHQTAVKNVRANGDPLGSPGTENPALGIPKPITRPLTQKDQLGSKAFVAQSLHNNFLDLGITGQAARTQGIHPAVQAVEAQKQKQAQKDIDAQLAAGRERQKHINDELTPRNYAADKAAATHIGKMNDLNYARQGSLINRAVPGFDAELAKGTGVQGGLEKLAAGIVETAPEMLATGGLGESLGLSNALGKLFAVQGAVGVGQSAGDTEMLKKDPAQYATLLIANAFLTATPFVKQYRENAILHGVAEGTREMPPKMAGMLEQKANLPKGSLASNPELQRYAAQTITGKAVTMPEPKAPENPAEMTAQPVREVPTAHEATNAPSVQTAAPKPTQTPEATPGIPDWLAKVKALIEEADNAQNPQADNTPIPGQNAEGLISLNSGLNPLQAIRDADNLDRPGFTTERPKRDYGVQDTVRSPLSLGEQPGVYERVGGKEGKAVSDAFRDAQRGMEADSHNYQSQLDEINAHLDRQTQQQAGSRWGTKKLRPKIDEAFINLVEKDRTDPERIAASHSQGDIGDALRKHDALTEQIRQDIISERNARGIPTPADWGITEQGYYRHAFLGDIVLKDKAGNTIGTANTYSEAQKKALDYLQQNPNAELTASGRDVRAGDPTLRVSSKQYHKAVNNIAGQVNLTHQQIINDLRGIVGTEANKSKFFGALEQRTGAKGYSENYSDVMQSYAHQTARWKALNQLKTAVQPKIEKFRANGQPGLAEAIGDHLDALFGTPTKAEKQVGALIKEIPVLRNHIANPDMAFRALAQRLTKIQSTLKLSYNIKSSLVNLSQPLQTLWTRTSSKDFAALYADYMKPSTRQMLRDRGVFEAGTKLEGNTVQRTGLRQTPFQAASQINRGIGYLYGEKLAKAQRLSPEAIHRSGMEWAEKVEFDASAWNAPAALRSPQGRILGQFKSYPIKMAETLAGQGGILNRGNNVPKGEKAAGVLKTALSTVVPGGVKAASIGGKLVGGYALVNGLQHALQSQGVSEQSAKATAEAIYYGAPSLLDMDLSSSVSSFDLYEGNGTLDTLTKFLAGPNISTAADLADTAGKLKNAPDLKTAREVLGKEAQRLTPIAKQLDAAQQMATQPQAQVNVKGRGKQMLPLSKPGGLLRLGGFPPLETSRYWEKPKEK